MRRTEEDPRLRFRIWVGAALVEDVWVDASNPDADAIGDAALRRHKAIARQAEADGREWLVEMYDPAQPPGRAYVRFGSDCEGMVSPEPYE